MFIEQGTGYQLANPYAFDLYHYLDSTNPAHNRFGGIELYRNTSPANGSKAI